MMGPLMAIDVILEMTNPFLELYGIFKYIFGHVYPPVGHVGVDADEYSVEHRN